MVIMDIRIDNFYQFKNFHMNMSYPKKIVDSTIEAEHLAGLPNFRYKKVNIIMGANASGKTSLGRLLMKFTNDFSDQNYTPVSYTHLDVYKRQDSRRCRLSPPAFPACLRRDRRCR